MRHVTEKGLALITGFEGFAAKPYLCPAGYLTVGYGHVVHHGEDFSTPVSEDGEPHLLAHRARKLARQPSCKRYCP